MIKPISSAGTSFRAIYNAKNYMKPAQVEVADRINYMLTSDKFKNEKGKTLEEQAGVKADIFINQPSKSKNNEKNVDVSLAITQYIDMSDTKFGKRDVFDIGTFDINNIETFPDKFKTINNQINSEKMEKRMNIGAIIISCLIMLGVLLAKNSDVLLNLMKKL